jgi:predicted membrane protein
MNGAPSSLAPRVTGRLIVGGLLIFFGLLFTLDNFGVIDAGDVVAYWPVILIVIGVLRVLQPRNPGQRVFGVVMIGLGIFFQLQELGLTSLQFRDLWPAILVVIGGSLIWRAFDRNRALGSGWAVRATPAAGLRDSAPHQSDFAFMGGVHRVVESSDYHGGDATAVMGAVELDLRGARIANPPAVLDVFALWGGIEITVPPEWRVETQVTPILGGVEKKARAAVKDSEGPEQVLVVRGTALMGGVEIKS